MMNSKRPRELGYLFVVGGPGKSGSSTISKLLSRHFNLTRIYGGQMMRDIAKKEGFDDMLEFLRQITPEHLAEVDKVIDSKLLKLAYQPNMLIESKCFAGLATKYQIPCTVKIWLDADIETRVKRSQTSGGTPETREELEARYNQDLEKNKKEYDIDYSSPKKYNDIVIDTSKLNEYQTLKLILDSIENGGYLK